MSMLPDGAEAHIDDWTIFFLNQTSFNTISPVLALDSEENLSRTDAANSPDGPGLLCVLNLVRTTRNEALKRYACIVATSISPPLTSQQRRNGCSSGDMYSSSIHTNLQGMSFS